MNFPIPVKIQPAVLGTFLIVALAGCGRDGVKVYHVTDTDAANPAPPSAPATMPPTMPAGLPAPDNSGLPSLQYTLPAGWEKKAPTAMRVASFGISQDGKQADISVVPMGGMAGGNLANVNRWRGQVGLEPVDENALPKMTEKISIAGQDAELFDIAGGNNSQRIIASMLHRNDTAWFFKITGDDALVEAQKPAFISFLKTVSFGAPTAAASAPDMNQLPPSHPPIGGMMPAAQNPTADAGSKPAWTVPAGWQPAPLTQFLIAKFVVDSGDAQAAVNVSSLAGDGGGLLPNVNRWRGQLGLAPATDADLANLPTIDVSGVKATLIELSGTDARAGKPAQLVGVVLPLGVQTWFYKLMGDPAIVAQQKDAFIKFVQSAKYPDAH